jgi:hypothetical protein
MPESSTPGPCQEDDTVCILRTRSGAEFDFEWESQLLRLQAELSDGSYIPGAYRNFYIHEPKRRKISAAPFRDRVVHHAVVRVLEPNYESRLVDTYSGAYDTER